MTGRAALAVKPDRRGLKCRWLACGAIMIKQVHAGPGPKIITKIMERHTHQLLFRYITELKDSL